MPATEPMPPRMTMAKACVSGSKPIDGDSE